MNKTYFAMDGSYGSSEGLAVYDTSDWTEDDWSAIDMATDSERSSVAAKIVARLANRAQERLFDEIV